MTDKAELRYAMREAQAEIVRLRREIETMRPAMRVLALFERAMLGPDRGECAGVDIAGRLGKLSDELEVETVDPYYAAPPPSTV
jgi:hypothetical protein